MKVFMIGLRGNEQKHSPATVDVAHRAFVDVKLLMYRFFARRRIGITKHLLF